MNIFADCKKREPKKTGELKKKKLTVGRKHLATQAKASELTQAYNDKTMSMDEMSAQLTCAHTCSLVPMFIYANQKKLMFKLKHIILLQVNVYKMYSFSLARQIRSHAINFVWFFCWHRIAVSSDTDFQHATCCTMLNRKVITRLHANFVCICGVDSPSSLMLDVLCLFFEIRNPPLRGPTILSLLCWCPANL